MCRSVSEGGQRCAAHTREKVTTAVARVEEAAASGDMEGVASARVAWEDAAAEFASTNEGRDLYRAQAAHADATGDVDTAALLNTIVARGEALRAANRETAALLAAIRMPDTLTSLPANPAAPVVPSSAEMALSPAAPGVPAMVAAPLGRDTLTDVEFEMLSKAIDYLSEVEPYVAGGLRRPYFRTAAQLTKAVDVLSDPDATDADLADAFDTVHKLHLLNRFKPDQNTLISRVPGNYTAKQAEYDRVIAMWEKVKDSGESLSDDLVYGMADHPNAGEATFKALADDDNGLDLKRITDRPNFPLSLLKDRLMKQAPHTLHDRPLADSAWERLREARLTDNSVAMVLAMTDPDSYQRNEAVLTVEMADIDSFTREDRTWLANHLGSLPGGPEKKVTIARSLAEWSKAYGDATDRRLLAFAFRPGSGLPAETVRFNEELDAFDKTTTVEMAKPRRGWLSR